MRWFTAVVLAVALFGACLLAGTACGTRSSADTDAGDGSFSPPSCGSGPYATINALVTSYTTGMPVEGVSLTLDPSPCSGTTWMTDVTGSATVKVTTGVAINPRAEAVGYLTERTGEQIYRGDFDSGAPMLPTLLVGLLPHWSATAPDVLVVVFVDSADAGADAGPCQTVSGATVSVVGHPEAVVTYYQTGGDGGAPSPDSTLTATTDIGLAEVSGLAGGATVTLQVASSTCPTVSFTSYPHTGRYTLENGVLTGALARLVPVP